ncbi:hypothetical protein CYLTODRAFT_136759 [Cylindrobasidium torrendii FP15055 ss-10]|uniref:Uncharacterized protein n=1 Tax=Cylindrobasidium torrendii FP15055 ss-10 TaxID=1314674 RepID=A0A0D7AZ06_9AGAR|nr:hypothetical protein CYLTODRAFT_136759 [Cylindrobasidium torrendii FP15055 ss-10]
MQTLRRLEFTEMRLQESARQNTAYRKAVDQYEESIAAIQTERSKEYKEKSSHSWTLSWQSRNARDSMLEEQMKDTEKIKAMEADLAARPTNAYFLSVQQEAQAALEAAEEENRRAKDDLSRTKANLEKRYQTIENERDAMIIERNMAYARAKDAVDCILQIKTLVHKGDAERDELMRGFSQRPRVSLLNYSLSSVIVTYTTIAPNACYGEQRRIHRHPHLRNGLQGQGPRSFFLHSSSILSSLPYERGKLEAPG